MVIKGAGSSTQGVQTTSRHREYARNDASDRVNSGRANAEPAPDLGSPAPGHGGRKPTHGTWEGQEPSIRYRHHLGSGLGVINREDRAARMDRVRNILCHRRDGQQRETGSSSGDALLLFSRKRPDCFDLREGRWHLGVSGLTRRSDQLCLRHA